MKIRPWYFWIISNIIPKKLFKIILTIIVQQQFQTIKYDSSVVVPDYIKSTAIGVMDYAKYNS